MFNASQKLSKSVTHRILAMKFAGEFILIYPLYTIMFGERGNVDAQGIGIILGLGLALSVLLEIPTGIIADKVPRKYVLLASMLAKIAGLAVWLALPFFTGYLLAAVFFALSAALESGALQAYLYGTLGVESKKYFGKFWARVNAMVMVSYTIAYILASLIGVNYPVLITLSIMACGIGAIVCAWLPLDTIEFSETEVKPKIFKSALAHIVSSRQLIKLLLSAIIVVAIAQVAIEYISLYYKQVGVTTRYVPLLMAAGNMVGAAMFWTLHSWEKFLDKQKVLLTSIAILVFVASFYGGVVIACLGMLIFTRFVRVLQVQFESNIQHLSSNTARATISSIGSFGATIVAAAMVAIIGASAVGDSIVRPIRIGFVMSGIVFVLLHILLRYKTQEMPPVSTV